MISFSDETFQQNCKLGQKYKNLADHKDGPDRLIVRNLIASQLNMILVNHGLHVNPESCLNKTEMILQKHIDVHSTFLLSIQFKRKQRAFVRQASCCMDFRTIEKCIIRRLSLIDLKGSRVLDLFIKPTRQRKGRSQPQQHTKHKQQNRYKNHKQEQDTNKEQDQADIQFLQPPTRQSSSSSFSSSSSTTTSTTASSPSNVYSWSEAWSIVCQVLPENAKLILIDTLDQNMHPAFFPVILMNHVRLHNGHLPSEWSVSSLSSFVRSLLPDLPVWITSDIDILTRAFLGKQSDCPYHYSQGSQYKNYLHQIYHDQLVSFVPDCNNRTCSSRNAFVNHHHHQHQAEKQIKTLMITSTSTTKTQTSSTASDGKNDHPWQFQDHDMEMMAMHLPRPLFHCRNLIIVLSLWGTLHMKGHHVPFGCFKEMCRSVKTTLPVSSHHHGWLGKKDVISFAVGHCPWSPLYSSLYFQFMLPVRHYIPTNQLNLVQTIVSDDAMNRLVHFDACPFFSKKHSMSFQRWEEPTTDRQVCPLCCPLVLLKDIDWTAISSLFIDRFIALIQKRKYHHVFTSTKAVDVLDTAMTSARTARQAVFESIMNRYHAKAHHPSKTHFHLSRPSLPSFHDLFHHHHSPHASASATESKPTPTPLPTPIRTRARRGHVLNSEFVTPLQSTTAKQEQEQENEEKEKHLISQQPITPSVVSRPPTSHKGHRRSKTLPTNQLNTRLQTLDEDPFASNHRGISRARLAIHIPTEYQQEFDDHISPNEGQLGRIDSLAVMVSNGLDHPQKDMVLDIPLDQQTPTQTEASGCGCGRGGCLIS